MLSSSVRRTPEGGCPHMLLSRTTPARIALHCVRLLFGEIANHRQLVHLSLICLHEDDDPENQPSKANQKVKGQSNQSQEGHQRKNRECHVQNKQSPGKKQALPRMEADKATLVVGLHHQENT